MILATYYLSIPQLNLYNLVLRDCLRSDSFTVGRVSESEYVRFECECVPFVGLESMSVTLFGPDHKFSYGITLVRHNSKMHCNL